MSDSIQTYNRPTCLVCGNNGKQIYTGLKDQLYGAEGLWNMSQCSNSSCKHLWLSPCPTEDDLWKVYKNYYTHEVSGSGLPGYINALIEGYLGLRFGYPSKAGIGKKLFSMLMMLNPVERAEFDFSVLSLKHKPGQRILDVGCGNGLFLTRLKKYGWETIGTDFDQKAIEECKRQGIEAYTGDVRSMDLEKNSFDVITLNHVIEHVSDPIGTLTTIRELLKPDGRLIIATPNGESRSRKKFHANWYAMQAPAHLNLFNRDNMADLAIKCGYEVEKGETTSRNEHWIYYVSKMLERDGKFDFKGKKDYTTLIAGKLYQYLGYVLNLFSGKIGGELFFVLKK